MKCILHCSYFKNFWNQYFIKFNLIILIFIILEQWNYLVCKSRNSILFLSSFNRFIEYYIIQKYNSIYIYECPSMYIQYAKCLMIIKSLLRKLKKKTLKNVRKNNIFQIVQRIYSLYDIPTVKTTLEYVCYSRKQIDI